MSLSTLPSKQPVAPTADSNAANDASQLMSLRDISYYIGPQRILSNIDIDIATNETVSLVGPNGAGKSTLVKLILGLIDPTKGSITAHQPLQLGYVPQRFTVPPILVPPVIPIIVL